MCKRRNIKQISLLHGEMFHNFKTVIYQFLLLLSNFNMWSQNQLGKLSWNFDFVKMQVKLGLNFLQGDLS